MLQGCCGAGGRSLKLSEFPETFISWLFKTHCCVLLMVAGSNMKADKPSVTSLNPSYKNRGNSGITARGVTRFPTAVNVTLRPCVLDSSTPLSPWKQTQLWWKWWNKQNKGGGVLETCCLTVDSQLIFLSVTDPGLPAVIGIVMLKHNVCWVFIPLSWDAFC